MPCGFGDGDMVMTGRNEPQGLLGCNFLSRTSPELTVLSMALLSSAPRLYVFRNAEYCVLRWTLFSFRAGDMIRGRESSHKAPVDTRLNGRGAKPKEFDHTVPKLAQGRKVIYPIRVSIDTTPT